MYHWGGEDIWLTYLKLHGWKYRGSPVKFRSPVKHYYQLSHLANLTSWAINSYVFWPILSQLCSHLTLVLSHPYFSLWKSHVEPYQISCRSLCPPCFSSHKVLSCQTGQAPSLSLVFINLCWISKVCSKELLHSPNWSYTWSFFPIPRACVFKKAAIGLFPETLPIIPGYLSRSENHSDTIFTNSLHFISTENMIQPFGVNQCVKICWIYLFLLLFLSYKGLSSWLTQVVYTLMTAKLHRFHNKLISLLTVDLSESEEQLSV